MGVAYADPPVTRTFLPLSSYGMIDWLPYGMQCRIENGTCWQVLSEKGNCQQVGACGVEVGRRRLVHPAYVTRADLGLIDLGFSVPHAYDARLDGRSAQKSRIRWK
jgi:hypothetical protein